MTTPGSKTNADFRLKMSSDSSAYDYDLPPELIAQVPAATRTDARMLVVVRETAQILHRRVSDLPEWLRPNDCLVLNDSRVVPARLLGKRQLTGGNWEGLFLEHDGQGNWRLLCRTRGKLRPGEKITLLGLDAQPAVSLTLIAKQPSDHSWIARPDFAGDPWEILDKIGRVPLPPYIRRGEASPADRRRYQTVYAREPGSVAAPTAGLHFTNELLAELIEQGIVPIRLTLHVGVGTFRPIATGSVAEHAMHQEWGKLEPRAVEQMLACKSRGGRIIAVGTTSVRVLETASQSGELKPWQGVTDLFIKPGHTFHAVDGLLTNFHLPRSSLLVLARTFGGDALVSQAYEEAIRAKYRFYSYGDCMLIL